MHICPNFKIYFLKLQSVFVGSIKIFVSKLKEGLASEPLIYLLKLQSEFVQTAKYICKIGQIFQSHGRQGSASEGVGGKRPGRCEPLLPVTASKTIGQCPPKPWHIHTWAKVGNTETQKDKYITPGANGRIWNHGPVPTKTRKKTSCQNFRIRGIHKFF